MGQHDQDTGLEHRHRQMWELLPWYVNGTLEEDERTTVDQHLKRCELCRKEAERCTQIATTVRHADDVPASSASHQFARLMAEIDTPKELEPSQGRGGHGLLTGLHTLIGRMSPGVRWILAAQGALILVLSGVLIWQVLPPPEPAYRTLSGTGAPQTQAVMRMRVIFAADTLESQIRTLLLELDGRIVNGPSPIGAYTVEFLLSGDFSETADSLPEQIREHPGVTLAEPIEFR